MPRLNAGKKIVLVLMLALSRAVMFAEDGVGVMVSAKKYEETGERTVATGVAKVVIKTRGRDPAAELTTIRGSADVVVVDRKSRQVRLDGAATFEFAGRQVTGANLTINLEKFDVEVYPTDENWVIIKSRPPAPAH